MNPPLVIENDEQLPRTLQNFIDFGTRTGMFAAPKVIVSARENRLLPLAIGASDTLILLTTFNDKDQLVALMQALRLSSDVHQKTYTVYLSDALYCLGKLGPKAIGHLAGFDGHDAYTGFFANLVELLAMERLIIKDFLSYGLSDFECHRVLYDRVRQEFFYGK